MQLDVRGALRLGLIEIVFVFLFVDLFDNVGTLLAVGKKAKLFERADRVPRLNRILYSDAIATVTGSHGRNFDGGELHRKLGRRGGGRTFGRDRDRDRPAFRGGLFVAPLAGAIPQSATAPALIVVGSLMMTSAGEIAWTDPEIAIPAFLTMIGIPLLFSIANGLAFGFIAFTLIKVLRGRFRQVSWMVYALTALFIPALLYMGR